MHKSYRPVYLNLFKIRQPIGAIVSIIHRITGVLMVLALPVALSLLQQSLVSPEAFQQVLEWFATPVGRVLLYASIILFTQHFYSGVRHLLLDIDVGVDIASARVSARATLVATLVTVLIFGVALA